MSAAGRERRRWMLGSPAGQIRGGHHAVVSSSSAFRRHLAWSHGGLPRAALDWIVGAK
jgi:hypothetical protein